MQNLLLDCKKILITFSLLTLFMLVGAESTIVVELGFSALQHILVIWSAVVISPYHSVSSSVNVST